MNEETLNLMEMDPGFEAAPECSCVDYFIPACLWPKGSTNENGREMSEGISFILSCRRRKKNSDRMKDIQVDEVA